MVEAKSEYPTGWVCPRCGMVHAPWVAECGCAAPSTSNTGDTPWINAVWSSLIRPDYLADVRIREEND